MPAIFFTAINRRFGSVCRICYKYNHSVINLKQKIILGDALSKKIYTQIFSNSTSIQQFSCLYNQQVCHLSTSREPTAEKPEQEKLTLYQKLKLMYKDYWYVLVPVHVITSVFWYGSFYYMAKSGVDIVALLESLHVSDKLIQPLREGHSTTGYLALAYALYKLSTPLRYTVTLGGTTVSISYLKQWGYIKPLPSKEQLKVIYKERKENFQDKKQEIKDSFVEKKQELKDNVIQKLKDIERSKKKL